MRAPSGIARSRVAASGSQLQRIAYLADQRCNVIGQSFTLLLKLNAGRCGLLVSLSGDFSYAELR